MKHDPEFSRAPKGDAGQAARELAACYARVFLGDDDGQRVLADLRQKFGLQRLVFQRGESGRFDALYAALVDGERRVMSEIEQALQTGAPQQVLPTSQPSNSTL